MLAQIIKYVPDIHPCSSEHNDESFSLLGDIIEVRRPPFHMSHTLTVPQAVPVTNDLVMTCRETPARVTITGRVNATETDDDDVSLLLLNWQVIQDGPRFPHLSIRAVMGLGCYNLYSSLVLPDPGSFVTLTGVLLSFEDDSLIVAVNDVINLGEQEVPPRRRQPPLQAPYRYKRRNKLGHRSPCYSKRT